MERMRDKLAYGNVVATLALFIALGGASYAAIELPKNSVGSGQIKNGAVIGKKIKKGAVTGAKIAPGTIVKSDIDFGSLGTVPSATNAAHSASADNATTLQGQTPAQIAAAAKFECPAGTLAAGGICVEQSARPASDYLEALRACGKENKVLPTLAQQVTFLYRSGIEGGQEWAGQIWRNEAKTEAATAVLSSGKAIVAINSVSGSHAYRCGVEPSS